MHGALVSVVDIVQQHLGTTEIQQISERLGIEPAQAQRAVNSAVPSMVAAAPGGHELSLESHA